MNEEILTAIIHANGDENFEIGMNKYSVANREQLIKGGIPYNIYMLVYSASDYGNTDRYGFVDLFENRSYDISQKLCLMELVEQVRRENHTSELNFGIAGQKACFLNCENRERMHNINNTKRFEDIIPWLEAEVLNNEKDKDKWNNLKKIFYGTSSMDGRMEKRFIYPIMKLGEKQITENRNGNETSIIVFMGIPFEMK